MAQAVFICHIPKDAQVAEVVCASLEETGIHCWMAYRDVPPGVDYGHAVMEAIDRCQMVLLIFSAAANESLQVRREIERAVHQGKAIVPLRIEDVAPSGALDYFLGTVRWIDWIAPPLERPLGELRRIVQSRLIVTLGSPPSAQPQPVGSPSTQRPTAAPPLPPMPAPRPYAPPAKGRSGTSFADLVGSVASVLRKPFERRRESTPPPSAPPQASRPAPPPPLTNARLDYRGTPRPGATPIAPAERVDRVHFSISGPQRVQPGVSFVLNVWAHLDEQRKAVLERIRETDRSAAVVGSKGPVGIERGAVLRVDLSIDGMLIAEPSDTILWEGEIGNATFGVQAPAGAVGGVHSGVARVSVHDLQIARIRFLLLVGAETSPANDLAAQVKHHRKAFASYASEDRDEVLGRIQGMQKVVPDLEVFLDVATLKSGQDWEKTLWREIPASDVFYLFWSAAAKASPWVEKEWRCALSTKGEDFIDPVPLVSPDLVPPPDELGRKHFNDWILAYKRGRN